jgi:Protein of unknown function (DUF3105)
LSKRQNSRLQRRDERAARLPGGVPSSRRARSARPQGRKASGLLDSIPWIPVAVIAGVALVAAFIVYAAGQQGNVDATIDWLEAERDSSSSLPGQYFPPHAGTDGVNDTATNPNSDDRRHFAPGTIIPICTQEQLDSGQVGNPVCYTSNPPTSGPHSQTPEQFRVLENERPKENLIHNMEHGGVVIWYNTDDQGAIDLLKSVAQDNIDRRRFVVMSRYSGMEPDTVAVTAWTRLDKFPVGQLTEDRVQDFIDAHHKRFNPEGF